MRFQYPFVLGVAGVLTAAAVVAYVLVQRRRAATLAAAGLRPAGSGPGAAGSPRRGAVRRHLPYALILAALPLLLGALARPQATIDVPHRSGTVVLVVDASNSMMATDLEPTRLGAAQAAATDFARAQPDTVDIGVVVFGQQALTTQAPSADHDEAIAAIKRLRSGGGTSLGQAILAALGVIVGRPVALPEDPSVPQTDLGYWGSATIVLFSDGENTAGPDVELAAGVAADAGVHIETVGVGTTRGTIVEVDGYQLATALNEDLLSTISATTGGSYHRAGDAASLAESTRSIDLRIGFKEEPVELTALVSAVAILLLTIGAVLMIRWYGRVI
jgi:Ca-activated chloride channel family protein